MEKSDTKNKLKELKYQRSIEYAESTLTTMHRSLLVLDKGNPHYSWVFLSMNVNAGNPDLVKLDFGLPKS